MQKEEEQNMSSKHLVFDRQCQCNQFGFSRNKLKFHISSIKKNEFENQMKIDEISAVHIVDLHMESEDAVV